MPAVRVIVHFGGPFDEAIERWPDEFASIIGEGIHPMSDPNYQEIFVQDKDGRNRFSAVFVLHTQESPVIFPDDQDIASAAVRVMRDKLRSAKLIPLPASWSFVTSKKDWHVEAESAKQDLADALIAQGATQQEVDQTLETFDEEKDVLTKRTVTPFRREQKSRPTRGRTIKGIGMDRPWMTYTLPGEQVPYWEQLGLHTVDQNDAMEEDLWRLVYRRWYNTTDAYREAQQVYNKSKLGRSAQKKYESQDKGKEARARYFSGKGGIEARAASNRRSKKRLKLGLELTKQGLSAYEIERIFYEGAWHHLGYSESIEEEKLRPLLKTEEDFDAYILDKEIPRPGTAPLGRINPHFGDDTII